MPTVLDSALGLTIVEKPTQNPGVCIASLVSEDYEGFIDTGNNPSYVDPHVYISVSWVKQIARILGFEEGDQLAEKDREIAELTAKLIEAEKAVAAIETLRATGFVTDAKKGRPVATPTQKKVAAKKPVAKKPA